MKKYVITIGILSSLLVSNFVAYADPTTQDSSGNLSVIRCIEQGNIGFGAFLSSMIYNDGLMEGIVEPWKDVLSRNQCQSSDIYTLIKQEDKIRSAIRDAFLTCNNQSIPQLKKAYQKMMVEVYYIRHIVDTELFNRLPVPGQLPLFKDASKVNRDQLYNDMSAKYISANFMSQTDFDLLFLKLEGKYKDRKDKYRDCSTGVWEPVGNKWKEFVKFFTEDAAGLKDAGKTIGASITGGKNGNGPSLVNDLKTMKFVEIFTGDAGALSGVGSYVGSFAQLNINNLTPTAALDEAKSFIDTHLNNGIGLTQGEFLTTSQGASEQYQMEQGISQIKADFDTRYKDAADGSMEQFINALDGTNVGKPDDGTLEIINDSFSPLNEVLSLSTKIKDRQCKQ